MGLTRSGAWVVAWLVVLAGLLGVAHLAAQAPAAAGGAPADIEAVDPIRCWWRTSTNAVRVGEPFSLVLTCAVVETATTTVVPDQSKLEPTAIQLQPFEVMGGQHGPDLRSGARRFFQYQYTPRLLGEDFFGKDVKIPGIQIEYYLESRVAGGESVRGRARTYVLPSASIRVLSLVPADPGDIRDRPSLTFTDIDRQRFRARTFFIGAVVLAVAGALVVIVALIGLFRQRRAETIVRRPLLSNGSLLRAAGRELRAVGRLRRRDGWTDELAGRATAALRVAGSIAQSSGVGQLPLSGTGKGHVGQLCVRCGVLWSKRVLVSGSATAETMGRAAASPSAGPARRACLTVLQTALARFTEVQFSRDRTLDETALDESIADSFGALRRLKIEQVWPVRKLRAVTLFGMEVGTRAWSR